MRPSARRSEADGRRRPGAADRPLRAIARAALFAVLSCLGGRTATAADAGAAFVDQVTVRPLAPSAPRPASGNRRTASPPMPAFAPEPQRNVAVIRQEGRDNASRIEQAGSGNFAELAIIASDGNQTVQSQSGERNRSRIAILGGGGNAVSIDQRGNGNSGELALEDSVGVDLQLRQTGDGLSFDNRSLSVSSSGTGGRPIIIEQTGR